MEIHRRYGYNQKLLDQCMSRLFDEAYSLSYAQQLKNKDIPEGGAKGNFQYTVCM
jgi:NAD-specific glutamate dehydrogenase